MQIFIDNDKLDFQLEKEKTLFDIIDAMRKWLSAENFIISELSVDNVQKDHSDTNLLKKQEIGTVSEINISTISLHELKLSQLNAIQEFFILVMKNIESGNSESLIKLLDDYSSIKPFLKSNIDRVYESNNGFIENILENKAEIGDHLEELRIFSENILIIAETRKNEIITPEKELEQLKNSFEKTAEDAGNVSILLQTGKDREAMETVIEFVEFLKKFSRILGILDIKKSIPVKKEEISEFNSMLKELCSAIENSDSVLVGDLLEYEIIPVVENILTEIK